MQLNNKIKIYKIKIFNYNIIKMLSKIYKNNNLKINSKNKKNYKILSFLTKTI